jgi:DNA protecting protein DprA
VGGPKLGVMGRGRGDEERAALFALLCERPAIGGARHGTTAWSTIASEVVQSGSAIALWDELHPQPLDGMQLPGGALERARAMLAEWHRRDFHIVTVLDTGYPLALRTVHQLPPALFVKGRLFADDVAVSVVGSRSASGRGISIASKIAGGLVERGISVISGLAAGIDAAAHNATLAAGGRPVGVLGTGINRTYPPQNHDLHRAVATAGALVSQFMPDAPPHKHTFPMRNATMSGLGLASVVVEASEYSGSGVQARLAVEHGRPVILTDDVVKSTSWGKQLQNRPGVHVAGNSAEVMGIVESLARNRDHAGPVAVLAGVPDPD